jgi:glycosyltransferase involved in cell wall biosynthesis
LTLRVCVVYDCLDPYTVGGAQRWYRSLARRLAAEGHQVTYVTLRQWERGHEPSFDGVTVRTVGPRMDLYTPAGRRRMAPPLVFGIGVLAHLARHGRQYDVVHTCSFPYFSVLAAAALRRRCGYRLVVDWFEVWTDAYWSEYLGRLGRLGSAIQRACVRVRQSAFCFSRLHAERLRRLGLRCKATVVHGLLDESWEREPRVSSDGEMAPTVVYAGRHIPEKRVPSLVAGFAAARREMPDLRLVILGDGPERPRVLREIERLGLGDVAHAPGFIHGDEVEAALRRAACLVLPSRREGYGLVVIEAASLGTPSVVVAADDNAAVELVSDGVNGIVAPSAEPEELGAAILRAVRGGDALRQSTTTWFRRNLTRLSITGSLDTVVAAYSGDSSSARL